MPSIPNRSRIILVILILCLIAALSIAATALLISKKESRAVSSTTARAAAFRSRESTQSTPFRFVVMADSRGSTRGVNESALRTIMGKVKKLSPQPKFIFFAGDMVGGGPMVTRQLVFWKSIMDDYYPLKTIYPAFGNHESNESVFSKAFSYLPNETVAGYGRTVYRIAYGNADFFVLNSNRSHEVTYAQRNWLDRALKNSAKKLHFVFFHEPAYPTGSHYGSSLDGNKLSRDKLWTIFDTRGATLVFVGHEHNYTRRHIDSAMNETIKGTRFSFKRRIYQVTNGSVGAPVTSTYKSKTGVDVSPKAVYAYSVIDVSGGKVSVQVFDSKDKCIDKFSIGK
ncbi:MAG: metallophosphoesterase family protein [Candidatus Aquicultor sp.]